MKTLHTPKLARGVAPFTRVFQRASAVAICDRLPALTSWTSAVTDRRHSLSDSPGKLKHTASRIVHVAWARSIFAPHLTLQAVTCLLVWGLLSLAAPTSTFGADNQPSAGFIALFNGRDLSGWKVPAGDNGHWKVMEGVIDYDAESEAKSDKSLWTEREFGDFVLHVDWRIKETPYVNPNVYYILPDGTHARDVHGKELKLALPDSDSGIYIRGSGKYQLNIWCWPIGSGEMYGIRTDSKMPADVRAAVTPRTQADKPVGEWNHFEITVRGDTVTVVLNGKTVIPGAQVPDLPPRGRIALQHHGGKRDGKWNSPPALLQFKNIFIKELDK